VPSRRPKSPASATASHSINEHLDTLRALLRLIDPESPFQPILLSSIDIVAWLAVFGRAAEQLDRSLREIPEAKYLSPALEACEPFLRLTRTLCQDAEHHAFPPDGIHVDAVPEMADFSPDSAICPEDAAAIDRAMNAASQTFEASAKHRGLLCRTLGLAAAKLKKQLVGPGGLLRQTSRRCRGSRTFRRQYGNLTDNLKVALAKLPDPEVTPWEKCRTRFAAVQYRLETDLLPALGTLVKELPSAASAGAKKRNALKATILRAITAFLEAHGLAKSLDTGLLAVQYHTLFRGLLAPTETALHRCGYLKGSPPHPQRLIDDIQRLGTEVIKKTVLTSWDAALPDADPYTTEVVLAALHHLEQPSENSDRSTERHRFVFGLSDGDLSRSVRSGAYAGANRLAERSSSRAAETKRISRTLEHLRRVGAAFHDRRQWTPTDVRRARSTQHRLWTVNPLLVLFPPVSRRLGEGEPPAEASRSTEARPLPTRRNRGTRPRAER
jgi:hypothetical protein